MFTFSKYLAKTLFRLNSIPLRSFTTSPAIFELIQSLSTIDSYESFFARNKPRLTPKPLGMFIQRVCRDYAQHADNMSAASKKRFNSVLRESLGVLRENRESMEKCEGLVSYAQAASCLLDKNEGKMILQEVERKLALKFNKLTARELAEIIEAYGRAGVTPDNLLDVLGENLKAVQKEEAFKLLSSLTQLKHTNAKLIGSLLEQLAQISSKFNRQDAARALKILVDIKERCVANKEDLDSRKNVKFYLTVLASTLLGCW
eukprot:TRINITY_DN4503_c0_g1_i3.p1 TRINITY_DN4503_c0_g1~~TRINITY_DN4503_c0_g1_i3.p1  ORF type:complete len:260 (-),score=55.37 TRINITY_DN4503_c0_g1_i3:1063-1842(-)